MMRTPSLRGRVVLAGAVTSIVLLVGVDLFVWFNLRERLEDNLVGLLESRAQLVREIGPGADPDELRQRLTALGVPAVVRSPGGSSRDADPVAPSRRNLPPPGPEEPGPAAEMDVALSDGTVVTVLVSRAGVDATLQRVLILELVGSLAAVALLGLLLVRTSSVALGPLDEVVQTARRIAAGRTGERLEPDRPETELGRMAVAFDEMLDALEEALAEARGAEEEARDAERRVRAFLAQAAHQLRTPVASLQASVDALLRIDQPEVREEMLDHLAAETARTSRLVTRLLRMAELDEALPLRPTPTDVDALIATEVARATRRRDDVAATVRCDVGVVDADPDALSEALANLLENAVRHAAGCIEVAAERVEDGSVAVDVSDDGPGVAPHDRERIFERFVSADASGGIGLGLPIARSIARAHGGELWCVDAGAARFRLVLPGARSGDGGVGAALV